MPSIANYYASVGVSTKAADLKKVDRYLELIKKKMDRFSKGLKTATNLEVKVKLNRSLATQKINQDLKRISDNISLEIKRFTVKHGALARAMNGRIGDGIVVPIRRFQINSIALAQYLNNVLRHLGGRGLTISPKISATAIVAMRQQLSLGLSGIFVNPVLSRNFLNQINASIRAMQQLSLAHSNRLHSPGFGMPSMSHFMRFGMASIPFIGGAIGLNNLNQANQEYQKNDLALKSVAGSKYEMYSDFLNQLGNRLGMTTKSLSPGFTQYLSSAQGTPLEKNIMENFSSFTEYGAVMGLGPEEMKGSLRALTQMVSKQQIYAEELQGQLAERMPAAVRIMADAVAGGDTKKLREMMKKGQLDPNVALPLFFEQLKNKSGPMVSDYTQTSRFQQGRMGKASEDMLKTFSRAGGEEGFARIFKSIADALKQSDGFVKSMGRGFNEMSKYVEFIIAMPGAIERMFEGKDSWFKDMLIRGGVNKEELESTMKSLKDNWTEVTIQVRELSSLIHDINFNSTFLEALQILKGITGGISGVFDWGKQTGINARYYTQEKTRLAMERGENPGEFQKFYWGLGAIGQLSIEKLLGVRGVYSGLNEELLNERARNNAGASYFDPNSPLYKDAKGAVQFEKDRLLNPDVQLTYEKPIDIPTPPQPNIEKPPMEFSDKLSDLLFNFLIGGSRNKTESSAAPVVQSVPAFQPMEGWWKGVENIGSGLKSIYDLPSNIREDKPTLQYEKPIPEAALPNNPQSSLGSEGRGTTNFEVSVNARIDVSGAQSPEEFSTIINRELENTWRNALLQFGNYT